MSAFSSAHRRLNYIRLREEQIVKIELFNKTRKHAQLTESFARPEIREYQKIRADPLIS